MHLSRRLSYLPRCVHRTSGVPCRKPAGRYHRRTKAA